MSLFQASQRPSLGKARRNIADQILERQREARRDVQDERTQKPRIVACTRHEEQLGSAAGSGGLGPVTLSSSLSEAFPPGTVLRLAGKVPPPDGTPNLYFKFYANSRESCFSDTVKGVSILRSLAEKASLTDKEIELIVCEENEAWIGQIVLVMGERFFSKRDLWHFQLAMLQDEGHLLYRGCVDNSVQMHLHTAYIESLTGPSPIHEQVLCGIIREETQMKFKSSSLNLFVLVQLSAELWAFGLSGRPYWDVLLECLSTLVEKSLRQAGGSEIKNGHYIHMILFTRARKPKHRRQHTAQHTSSRRCRSSSVGLQKASPSLATGECSLTPQRRQRAISCVSSGSDVTPQIKPQKEELVPDSPSQVPLESPQFEEADILPPLEPPSSVWAPEAAFATELAGEPGAPCSEPTTSPCGPGTEQDYEDFYEVFWEGYAKALPPVQVLVGWLRQIILRLAENSSQEEDGPGSAQTEPRTGDSDRDFRGSCGIVGAKDILDASRGNILECLNLALDTFDQHHLDRMLKVTGQAIILLTAGNGVIHSATKELYELTHRRCNQTAIEVQLLCVREPPLHETPLVLWPDGPVSPYHGPRLRRIESTNSAVGLSSLSHANVGALDPSQVQLSPPWLRVNCFSEVVFCPCAPIDWLQGSLLPLECLAPKHGCVLGSSDNYSPEWSESQCNLEPDVEIRQAPEALPEAITTAAKVLNRSPQSSPVFGPSRALAAHASLSSLVWNRDRALSNADSLSDLVTADPPPRPPGTVGKEFLESCRMQPLRSVFVEVQEENTENLKEDSTYTVENGGGGSGESVSVMQDLAGLRLAALPASSILNQTPLRKLGWRVGSRGASLGSLAEMDGTTDRPRHLWASRDVKAKRARDAKSAAESQPWALRPGVVPISLRTLIIRTPCGMQWNLEAQEQVVSVKMKDTQRGIRPNEYSKSMDGGSSVPYRGFFVRRRHVRSSPQEHDGGQFEENVPWVQSRRIFHMPMELPWSFLDQIITGAQMPPALPYPVEQSGSDLKLDIPGWKLRGALKQHFYVLLPRGEAEALHMESFRCSLERSGGRINIGSDPFSVVPSNMEDIATQQLTIESFGALKAGIEELCFGNAEPSSRKKLEISTAHVSETVKRGNCRVQVRDMKLPSSFSSSCDWFELFHDTQYSPPKIWHLALQWIVCSSMHLTHFVSQLRGLCERNGFRLVKLPICQLFPQPSPPWVWGEDAETNFDRIAFYPRRKIQIPSLANDDLPRLYGLLLTKWLENDKMRMLFLFSSPTQHYPLTQASMLPFRPGSPASRVAQRTHKIFQRLQGWTLCDAEGVCLVTLRKEHIFWYENSSIFTEESGRAMEKKLQKVTELRTVFFSETHEVITKFVEEVAKRGKLSKSETSTAAFCGRGDCAVSNMSSFLAKLHQGNARSELVQPGARPEQQATSIVLIDLPADTKQALTAHPMLRRRAASQQRYCSPRSARRVRSR